MELEPRLIKWTQSRLLFVQSGLKLWTSDEFSRLGNVYSGFGPTWWPLGACTSRKSGMGGKLNIRQLVPS